MRSEVECSLKWRVEVEMEIRYWVIRWKAAMMWGRTSIEKLKRGSIDAMIMQNDDDMFLDFKVHGISSVFTSLKTNDAVRHVTSSDDDEVDSRQIPQLRWLKVERLIIESVMIDESVGEQLLHSKMLVTGSTKVHVTWTLYWRRQAEFVDHDALRIETFHITSEGKEDFVWIDSQRSQ